MIQVDFIPNKAIKAQSVYQPLETVQIQIIVFFGQEISKNAPWISTTYLIGGKPKINTLCEVPKLCHDIIRETPVTIHKKVTQHNSQSASQTLLQYL